MSVATMITLFMEGVLAFISPCLLPVLPVFFMRLAGDIRSENQPGRKSLISVAGFVLGFTLIFILLGATATGIGSLLTQNRLLLQRIGGVVMILFGLNITGWMSIPFLNKERRITLKRNSKGFWSSLLFGLVFALGWSPCLGTFLGAAMLQASNSDTVWNGMLMLLVFSLGLGLPFVLTSLFINSLASTFDWIKKHYRVINLISGILLMAIGVLMIFGISL